MQQMLHDVVVFVLQIVKNPHISTKSGVMCDIIKRKTTAFSISSEFASKGGML